MPGPPVLLSSYAARVISCGTGVLSSLSPFGGVSLVLQSLVGARWSSSGHLTSVFSFLNALFVLASASTRRFGYSMLGFSVALLPGAGVRCPLLSSRSLWRCAQAPPLLLGLRASLYRPDQRQTIAMGECYILCRRSGVPGPLERRIVSNASRSCCRRL